MKTTPEQREEIRKIHSEALSTTSGGETFWSVKNTRLEHAAIPNLLDDIDELIKSNAILSMWTCCAANVCDEAKNHEEARKATETCMKDLNEEIRALKARAVMAEADVARLRTALEDIVGLADCYNGPCVEIAQKALEGKK